MDIKSSRENKYLNPLQVITVIFFWNCLREDGTGVSAGLQNQ